MYFDISPPLQSEIAVFPGDQAFSRKVALSFAKKDHLELSSMETTLHVGAHADAPSHYSAQGQTIDQRNLELYLGKAQVVEVTVPKGFRIGTRDVDIKSIQAPRVLFRTGSFPNPNQWNNDFNSFSPDLLRTLNNEGVTLVGIDTPSVDPWDSKALESHQVLADRNMAVLEGLVLDHVPVGLYRLVALPLRLAGADASPVRAVLFKDQDWLRL